jgi:serine/threonine protein kinase
MKSEHWSRLRPLLQQALELSGEARRQYLDGLRGDDRDLREDLDQLLANHERLGSLTAPNAMELAASEVAPRLQEEAELDQARVGQHIQSYRLVRLLGAGGMGAVYLTERSESGFTQTVALKVVRRMLGSQAARERFERERQILAGLQHPGLAPLFDGGQTAEGQSFYTMEYVDGVAITDYCDHQGQTVAARVRLLLQVAVTLSYAHRNLVVHRDIKPSNVLVTKDGRVKLIDFGLAKLLNEHAIPSVTQTGLGPMTPVYAAPEQFHGQATGVSTDIYQFGVLSYLLFTGCLPYRADPNDNLAWARAVCEDDPVTLMRAAEVTHPVGADAGANMAVASRRRLPKDLDAIVRKCLEKSPDHRYRSADALISDLEAFAANRPVSVRPAGPLYFTWRFVQRHRISVAATLLALGILATSGVFALQQSYTATRQAERAARETELRNVTRAMLTDLLRIGPASAVAQRPRSALEALDQGAERTLQALGTNVQHRAIAIGVLAESYLELDHPQRARTLIERSLPSLGVDKDRLPIEMLNLDLLLARAATELGDPTIGEQALNRAERAIEIQTLPPDAPARLMAATVRIRLATHQGQEGARETAARLLGATDRPPLNETIEFADLLRVYAMVADDHSLSMTLAERAWKIVAKHYGDDSPAALAAERAVIWLDLWFELNRFDTDRMIERQEALLREQFGDASDDYADLLSVRCYAKAQRQQYASAEADCRKVASILEQSTDASTKLLADANDNEAELLLKLDRPGEALASFEREFALRSKSFSKTHRDVVHARIKIAEARCHSGDIDMASREFDAAITDFVAEVGALNANEALYAAGFAACLLDGHDAKRARSVMESHARLDSPRKGMTDARRAAIDAVWQRLEH